MSTWIFLRGLTRESRHWGDFPECFAREIPGALVFSPDLPGNGTQCMKTSPLRVEAMVESLRAQLLASDITPPYHLLAMSLGAMVAVAWAQHHADEIRGAVLINTSLRPFSPFYQRLRPDNYLRLLKLALGRSSDQDWESTILELTSRHTTDADLLLEHWLGYRRENPVTLGNALRQLIAALRYRAPRVKPRPPLLVLTSRHDALVDSACSRQLAQQWNTACAIHPSAGHDLPLDDGAWVSSQVARWLTLPPGQDPAGRPQVI